jgi:ABC-2 type transport system ATP-binding protein
MWDTIRGLVVDGCTVLLNTQYLDEADQLANRVSVIDRGRKVAEGTPNELKSSVGNSTLQLHLAPGTDQELASVPLDAADVAADVLIGLRQSGIGIASVSVTKPTLDEVFLALTGHDTNRPEQCSSARTGRPWPRLPAGPVGDRRRRTVLATGHPRAGSARPSLGSV